MKGEAAGWGARLAPAVSLRRGITAVLVAAFALAGCESQSPKDYFDPYAQATREDFREGLAARPPAEAEAPPPIPELQPIISAPALGPEVQSRRVTVTVTETTPIKDVLIELAREAKVDLELDPRIEGGVIFSAYDRPFEEVIRQIADLAGLRLKVHNGVLRIELDEPFNVDYKVGYLNLTRTTESTVGASSSVATGGDSSSGTTGTSGGGQTTEGGASTSTTTGISTADFWKELEDNLRQIITNTGKVSGLIASCSQQIEHAAEAAGATASDPDAQARVFEQLVSASGCAAAPETGETKGQEPKTTGVKEPETFFTVNKHAGIVSVFGTEREHRAVEAYLRKLKASVMSQVLIEAKVLEVSLDDEYRFGINWASLFSGRANFAAPFNTASTGAIQAPPFSPLIAAPVNPVTATANVLTISGGGADLNVIANLVEQFGTVRALSSPRLTVMQGQTAVLKVAQEQVFFRVEFEQTTTTGDQPTVVSTVNAIPNTVTVGLVLTVQPAINLDTDEVTLTLRPTITSVVGVKNDPAVELEANRSGADVVSQIPEIGVQEIDSVVTVHSGNVIVIGGLMRDRSTVEEVGVPLLSEIPWIGQAFKSKNRTTKKSELVVFLRATILKGKAVDPYDVELYHRFGEDRRPLVF